MSLGSNTDSDSESLIDTKGGDTGPARAQVEGAFANA